MGLPNDYKLQSPGKGNFEPIPQDMYQCVIRKIELKKDQPVYQSTEVEDVLEFEFEVVEDGQYKGRRLWKKVRPIMSAGWSKAGKSGSPSWLYKLFCAVNNIQLSDDEAKATDANTINGMIGKQVRLSVKVKDKWNNITDMLPIKSELAVEEQVAEDAAGEPDPVDTVAHDDVNVDDIPF